MSANGKQGKTMAGHAIDGLSLAIVFGILWGAVRLVPSYQREAGVIGALGFLLLAGTLTSQLIEIFRLPHLTGYLVAGLLAGPHVLRLIDQESVKQLAPVNTLALALIALAGGAELRLDQVKRGLKSLLLATALQSSIVLLAMAGFFVLLRPMLPFTAHLGLGGVAAVGLLWGVIATTRSPSATLGILSQTRARGPVASFSLAFVMLSDVTVMLMLAAAMMIARPLLEPGSTFSLGALRGLGHEIVGSVSIGTTLGVLLAGYMRVSGRQLLVVLVALAFGATEVLHYLRFEPLLTFMVAGFVVQNLSRQGPRLLHEIEEMGGVVYVVFFAIAGADLDVPLLRKLWPVALLLGGARAAVTYGTHRLSSRLARDETVLRRWGWASLIAQAGLTQGLAGIIEREFPTFGTPFRALVFANVALNAVVGPILFKLALDRAKETKSPAPAIEQGSEESDEVATP